MAAPNGNGNLIVFPLVDYSTFYLCSSCNTHLISGGNTIFKNPTFVTCRNPVNVKLGHQLRTVPLYGLSLQVFDVSCMQCGLPLGEYITGGIPANMPAEPTNGHVPQLNTHQFATYKLLYWNGNYVVDALRGQILF